MARYAIIVGDMVLNVVESDQAHAEAYAAREGGVAVASATAGPGDTRTDGVITRPVRPEPVPRFVSRRQLRQALILAGLAAALQAAIDGIANNQAKAIARSELDDEHQMDRQRPALVALLQLAGMTDTQIDDLWRSASRR
jgi:hypothetical protein